MSLALPRPAVSRLCCINIPVAVLIKQGLAFLGNYAVLYLLDVGITNVFIILMIREY